MRIDILEYKFLGFLAVLVPSKAHLIMRRVNRRFPISGDLDKTS